MRAGTSEEDALFGIYNYGEGSDESYIKANKAGLELFAADILEAAAGSKAVIADPENSTIGLDSRQLWVDEKSDTLIDYVEPLAGARQSSTDSKKEIRNQQTIFKIGCLAMFVIVAICLIIGLVTIVNGIF